MIIDRRVKKWLFWVVTGVVLLLIAHALLDYFLLGRLAVTTSGSGVTITLVKGAEPGQTPIKQVQNKLSAQLGPGDYTVSISDRTSSTQKLIHIYRGKTTRFSVGLVGVTALEAVSGRATHSLVASSSELFYADLGNDGSLYRVDSQGETLLDGTHDFSSIKWQNTSFGVGQDFSGQLYTIQNGAVAPLNTPFANGKSDAGYTVAPNGEIYVAVNSSLYRGTAGGGFTKIYALQNQTAGLAASSQAVAIFDYKGSVNSQEARAANSIITVIPQDSTQAHTISAEADQGAWSPNGAYLVTTNEGGTTVWDAGLQKIASVPKPQVTGLVWLNNNQLLYAVTDNLWLYSVSSSTSRLLATTSGGFSITEITPSEDGAYVYLLTENQQSASPAYQLSRVGLHKQPMSNVVGELQVFLPNMVDGCLVGYVNFTRPIITVEGTAQYQQDCLEQAKSYLQVYNIDTSNLEFSFTPWPIVLSGE